MDVSDHLEGRSATPPTMDVSDHLRLHYYYIAKREPILWSAREKSSAKQEGVSVSWLEKEYSRGL